MLTGLGMIGLLTISFSSVVANVWKLSGKWKSGMWPGTLTAFKR